MNKLSPVLCVEKIEPCLPFWCDRLAFAKTVEVPEGEDLGFAILQKGAVEIMLQSRASIVKDNPRLANEPFTSGGVALYIEVDALAPIVAATQGCEILVPERTTFYGMHEIGVRAPGGFLVMFAAKSA